MIDLGPFATGDSAPSAVVREIAKRRAGDRDIENLIEFLILYENEARRRAGR